MHKFASFNHQILPASDIKINAISSASLYGKGVFTTIGIKESEPFLWDKHWKRLISDASKLGIDSSLFPEAKVFESLKNLLVENGCSNGRSRLTVFDESASRIWELENRIKTSILIQTADVRCGKNELTVGISPFPINSKSPIVGIKSCNYLDNLHALDDAISKGFDEAIRLNERDEVVSACMANVFWQSGKKLFTPLLETGCLPGTMREFLLENERVDEVVADLEKLKSADSVFLTSSGIGKVSVKHIDFDR